MVVTPGWLARLAADIAAVATHTDPDAYEVPGRLIPAPTMMALARIRAPKGPRGKR